MQTDEKHLQQNVKRQQERQGRGSRVEAERKERGSVRGSNNGGNSSSKRYHSGSIRGDMKAKLERSRQSARECRARKKLRYQYLEELVASREQAVLMLRQELDMYRQWSKEMEGGTMPEGLIKMLVEEESKTTKVSSQQENKPPPAQQ